MSYFQAIETVHALASRNRIDDVDVAFGDEGLEDQRERERIALDTVAEILRKGEEVDARFPFAPPADEPTPDGGAEANPFTMAGGLQMCLDMARNAIVSGDEEAESQELAVRTAEVFLVRHGQVLDSALVRLPPGLVG